LDEALIHAVIAIESGHNPSAKSKKGAYGLMQLMPETARKYQAERKNPEENIMAGAKYLSYLLSMFGNNLPLALAAYNADPAAVSSMV
jgi:soluble lytic murein transglycosylase-like protein